MDRTRLVVINHQDEFVDEIPPDEVYERKRVEEVNGEHSLTLTTTRTLEKEQRILTVDATNRWREYVVTVVDAKHQQGLRPIGTYICTWSLQHDLEGTVVNQMPGARTPVPASTALAAALSGTARWTRGTVTQGTTGGASMYYVSGWEAMAILVDVWGGEIDARITVQGTSVQSRRVDLRPAIGSGTVTRRFDYGADILGVSRKVGSAPVYARIIPRGKGEQTGDGYGRRITIESVNGGVEYLRSQSAEYAFRLPDGSGGWEYPTAIVVNEEMETPEDLIAWGRKVMPSYTSPQVTYEADLLQFSDAGMDVDGVGLGDPVHVVDRLFYSGGLRIEARVMRVEANELDETDIRLTLGTVEDGLAGKFAKMSASSAALRYSIDRLNQETATTADYLEHLVDHLNEQINATGGWTYLVPGQGMRTYDREVSDPAVGAEASAVVEVKGGSIRIANSKTPSGDWEWRTVFVSGHIAADMVTAANITAGYIGSPSGNYWNLDTGELTMAPSASLAGTTVARLKEAVNLAVVSEVDQWYLSTSGTAPVGGTWSDVQVAGEAGKYLWTRKKYTLNDGTENFGTPYLASASNGAYESVKAFDDALNQQAVFNRLTNNGALQGIYMSNGQLYVNASYIKTGGMSADLITTGKLQSADGSNYIDLVNNRAVLKGSLETVGGGPSGKGRSGIVRVRSDNAANPLGYVEFVDARGGIEDVMLSIKSGYSDGQGFGATIESNKGLDIKSYPGDVSIEGRDLYIQSTVGGGYPRIRMYGNTGQVYIYATSRTYLSMSGSSVQLYVNGVLKESW